MRHPFIKSSCFDFVIENIFLMFCILNTFPYSGQSQSGASSAEAQRLRLCLSIALRHSISAYKTKKGHDETEGCQSEKSFSSPKIIETEGGKQLPQVRTEATDLSNKKLGSQAQERLKKSVDDNEVQSEKSSQKSEFSRKRRLLRKKIISTQVTVEKDEEKAIKINPNFKIENVGFTAAIPQIRTIPPRDILQMREELAKRAVNQWQSTDPASSRRTRFLKHLQ